jgi:hypothetical protein
MSQLGLKRFAHHSTGTQSHGKQLIFMLKVLMCFIKNFIAKYGTRYLACRSGNLSVGGWNKLLHGQKDR